MKGQHDSDVGDTVLTVDAAAYTSVHVFSHRAT